MATFAAVAGSLFKYPVSSTPTTIPGVGGISFSGGDKTDINVTSISDETEVFIPGRRAAKEMSFPMYWDPTDAGQQAMLDDYESGSYTARAMSIVMADAGADTLTFSGYIKNMLPGLDVDGAHMYTVTIKLTTEITETP